MKHHVVDHSGNIINTILWDPALPYHPPDGHTLVRHDDGGPGWIWDGEKPVNPDPLSTSPPAEGEVL